MTIRAVTYARVSSDDRSKGGRNLSGQLEMCREYCLQHGYEILAELAEDDRGASGASFELEQLSMILEMAREQQFDVLVVRELDRLSRNLAKQLIIEEELKKYGAHIEYVLGDYSDTPEGNFMKNIRATVAEYERLKIAERNTRGRIRKVKTGSVMTHGQAPYGYRLVQYDNKWALEIDEPEADIVRLIFNLYTMGDGEQSPLSIFGIAQRLTSMKVPTYMDKKEVDDPSTGKKTRHGSKRRKYGEWSLGSVHHILVNETYSGVWHYGKRSQNTEGLRHKNDHANMIPVLVPSIIPPELWQEAQNRLSYNRENSQRNQKHQYLLSKRIICGVCGYKMGASPNYTGNRTYFYYACGHSKSIGLYAEQCSNTVTYSVLSLDGQVWNWIKELLASPQQLQDGLDEYRFTLEEQSAPLFQRLIVVDELLSDNHSKYDRLLDLYLSGDFPKESLIDHKTRLEKTIQSLEQEKHKLMAQINRGLTLEQEELIKDFAVQFAEGLSLADDEFQTRRQIIELLNVTATLTRENGQKVAYVSCVLGENIFELNKKKSGNNDDSGSESSQIGFSSFGMAGGNRFLRLPRRAVV
jgi:site-specific DNA recombinase